MNAATTATVLTEKTFATARAQAALSGYSLTRTDPADGPVVYFLERHGLVRQVHDLGPL